MRFILVLIAVAIVMFVAREQLGALMPAKSEQVGSAKPERREQVQYQSKTPEQCAEELGGDADEEAMLRCTTGSYSINMHGVR